MVHRGPAKGCQRCKDRHIKCDLERPACKQCVRLGFDCPGYRHEFDLILRDQTASIAGRHQKRTGKSRRISQTGPDSSTSPPPSLPRDLTDGLESHALAFLFTAGVVMSARDLRTSHGHLDFLQPLYLKAPVNSPVAAATTWLAVVLMGTYDKGRPYHLERQLLTKVVENTLVALKDPTLSLKDETLMVVLILSYGEHLRNQRYGRQSSASIIHQQGAEALIRKRGDLNFRNRTALSLFDAIRHNAVNQAILEVRKPTNWDLWDLDQNTAQLCDSYTPATELDACAVTVETLKRRVKSKALCADSTLRKDVLELTERLRLWPSHAPIDWLPQQGPFGLDEDLAPEVTYLFYQWHLLQVVMSHLTKELDMRTDPATTLQTWDCSTELQCIDKLIKCEDVLLSSCSKESRRFESAEETPAVSLPKRFPRATVEQCHQSPFGSRLVRQTLVKLNSILSKALQELPLPTEVASRYAEVVSWARRESDTIGEAFPLAAS